MAGRDSYTLSLGNHVQPAHALPMRNLPRPGTKVMIMIPKIFGKKSWCVCAKTGKPCEESSTCGRPAIDIEPCPFLVRHTIDRDREKEIVRWAGVNE